MLKYYCMWTKCKLTLKNLTIGNLLPSNFSIDFGMHFKISRIFSGGAVYVLIALYSRSSCWVLLAPVNRYSCSFLYLLLYRPIMDSAKKEGIKQTLCVCVLWITGKMEVLKNFIAACMCGPFVKHKTLVLQQCVILKSVQGLFWQWIKIANKCL